MGGGGAERQLVYLSRGMARLGWKVHVGLLTGGPNLADLQAAGASVHRLPARSSYDPRIPLGIFRLIRRIDPALVQTWLEMTDVLGGAACTLTGKPWILTQRRSPVETTGLKWRARNFLARYAAAVVSNTRVGELFWDRYLQRRVPSRMIPNALPLDEIDAVPPTLVPRARTAQKIILYVGRLDCEKNLSTLISALSLVARTHDYRALFVGKGDLEVELHTRVHQDGLGDRVTFSGWKPREEIWGLMKGADLFASISLREGMPNTVMEAMACGLPLVLSDLPEHRELVPSGTATLVDPHNPEAVAAGLRRALDTRPALDCAVQECRKKAAELSVDRMAEQYAALYREVIDART